MGRRNIILLGKNCTTCHCSSHLLVLQTSRFKRARSRVMVGVGYGSYSQGSGTATKPRYSEYTFPVLHRRKRELGEIRPTARDRIYRSWPPMHLRQPVGLDRRRQHDVEDNDTEEERGEQTDVAQEDQGADVAGRSWLDSACSWAALLKKVFSTR